MSVDLVEDVQQLPKKKQHQTVRPGSMLTPREWEVLRIFAEGKTLKDVGTVLGISERTARFHFTNITTKLLGESIAHTIVQAFRHGYLKIDANS